MNSTPTPHVTALGLHTLEQTRAILDSVFVGIVIVNQQGIEWMNGSAKRMFGGDLFLLAGQPISVVATPEVEHPLRRMAHWFNLSEGQSETFECRLKALDGREFWVVANIVATVAHAAQKQLTIAFLDIDNRRLAEQSIVQARSSLQRMVEVAPTAIALFDSKNLTLVQHNRMAALLLGRALPEHALAFRAGDAFASTHAQDEWPADLLRCMKQALQSSDTVWAELERGQGPRRKIWDARFVCVNKADGVHDQILLIASDVTQQRQAEQARLDAAIGQREMLVKEVHHRIKNNLQGVAGLLQQSAQAHPQAASVLQEASSQVHAIAQVHGLQVGSEQPLHLWDVLQSVSSSVQRMFGRDIQCQLISANAAAWVLPESESIPVALVLNELLTNAVKHSPVEAAVLCSLEEDNLGAGGRSLTLRINNQGQLRSDFEWGHVRSGVSGLSLVRALLPRRGAQLDLKQHSADRVEAALNLSLPCVYVLDHPRVVKPGATSQTVRLN